MYLLARDTRKLALQFAGLGLIVYALGIGFDALIDHTGVVSLVRWRWPLLFLPAIFWAGAVLHLPETVAPRFEDATRYGIPLTALIIYVIASRTTLIFDFTSPDAETGTLYLVFAVAIALSLFVIVVRVWRLYATTQHTRPVGVLMIATLFFILGTGVFLLPGEMGRADVLFGIGANLELLGIAVAMFDAFDEGEALLPDITRSFDYAAIMILLFGGQVALAMIINDTLTATWLILLLAVITTAIITQTFARPLRHAFERYVFARYPALRQQRAQLQDVTDALQRKDESLDVMTIDDEKFTRLTRRALGNMGNLQRLAASPLTQLPIVEQRLAQRGVSDNTLERAMELRAVLAESIERLKPRNGGDFGTSDEWRYYNALYFPYVVGLKPFSRRAVHDDLDETTEKALEWFRVYVPERTLHNWQNAAAALIAQDLRERVVDDVEV